MKGQDSCRWENMQKQHTFHGVGESESIIIVVYTMKLQSVEFNHCLY